MVTPAAAESGKAVMNSAAFLRDGRIEFVQSKMLLPTYDVFDEMRNFAPAKSQQLFNFCGNRMALTICEDAWNDKHFWHPRLYGVDPVEELVRNGGNFVLNISASPFWLGKRELRRDMLASIARNQKVPVAMVNQVGGNDSLVFDGSSLVIAPDGNRSRKTLSILTPRRSPEKCTSRSWEKKRAPTGRWFSGQKTTFANAASSVQLSG